MRVAKLAAILGGMLFVAAAVVYAQTSTGEVNGALTDKSGAAISGAEVKLSNQETKIISETQTNANGYFLFINVQSGSYVLTVEKQGFKTAQVSTFDIQVNQTLTQNIRLDLGQVNESITVNAEAPLLQSSTRVCRFAFNVFNMQILGTPGAEVTSGTLGVIHSIASTPRELQLPCLR